jgi:hypothetical protein
MTLGSGSEVRADGLGHLGSRSRAAKITRVQHEGLP